MTFAYDTCKSCGKPFVDHDGIIGTCEKLQKAEAMLQFFFGQMQMLSPKMNGQHSYVFRSSGWPMTHCKGPNAEEAVKAAMAEVARSKASDEATEHKMGCRDEIETETLVGEVLTFVDIDASNHEIMLTTQSGRNIRIYHDQDCCESVTICGTDGVWHTLIGKVLVEAKKEEFPSGDPPPEYPDSWTRTSFTFRTNDATVISRWIGESNGYYSESVSIEEAAADVQTEHTERKEP